MHTKLRIGLLLSVAALCGIVAAVLLRDGGQPPQRAMTAAAPFTPDARQITDCGDVRCFRQAFGNLASRRGAAVAEAELKRAMRRDVELERGCHSVAHYIGFGTLLHVDGDVGRALASGSDLCTSGFYHGVLTMAFAGVRPERLGARAVTLCTSPDLVASPSAASQCHHGIGHGLMLIGGYDLPAALEHCDELPVEAAAACWGGVFMENNQSSLGARSPWLRDDDPEFPCNAVDSTHAEECYVQLVTRLRTEQWSWQRTAQLCLTLAPRWRDTCVRSLGYAAESVALGDASTIRGICRQAERFAGTCIAGAARMLVVMSRNPGAAGALCASVSAADERSGCFEAIGSGFAASMAAADSARAGARCGALRGVGQVDRLDCRAGVRGRPAAGEGAA